MSQQRQRGIAATREGKIKLEEAKAATRGDNNRPWTYAKIAEVAGCEETTVKAFFGKKGKNDRVDKSYALAIVQALELELDDIVERSDITNSINWKDLCNRAFWEEKTRRKRATEMGHEKQFPPVPVGLVKRKVQPRRTEEEMPVAEAGMQKYQLTEKEIEERYEYEKFLAQVIGNAGENLAIIGEPGAGKTTWLDQIGQELIKTERYPIWIPLARLQGMTLEAFLLEKWLKENLQVLQPTPEQKQEFIEWFKTEKVWVLLDGADEMSAANPVVEIRESLTGWVNQARVVLSCRLNVWESNLTTLQGFDTYRTLCFEREQVEQFITDWFKWEKEPELGKQLAQRLQEAESARILDLVRNPLCLSLLCQSWKFKPGEIAETKAELYQKFCNNIYAWRQDESLTPEEQEEQQEQFNQKLAELALRGMSENVPLRRSLVRQVLGEQLPLLKNMPWLNVVYRDTRTDEPVYAFFHLTFQEYFAACAVTDGHFFLPSDHSREQPSSQPYRIFESRWREVILLWLGRGDVEKEKKEEFIKALVNFEDGCYQLYWYRAYFLAAAGISEFKACSLAEEIVRQVVKWGFGDFNIEKQEWRTFLDPIKNGARDTLSQTDRKWAIKELCDLLKHPQFPESICIWAAETLGKIEPRNSWAIAFLTQVLEQTDDESIRWSIAEILGEIDPGNPDVIAVLVQLLKPTEKESIEKESIRFLAAKSLRAIDPRNAWAITVLMELLEKTESESSRQRIAESLEMVDSGNPDAIAALVKLLVQTENENFRRQVAESLVKIDLRNHQAIVSLTQLLEETDNQVTCWGIAESLGIVDPGNSDAIATLMQILEETDNESTRWRVAESLGKIDPGNPQAIAVLTQVMKHTEHESVCWFVAYRLGQIDPGNLQAITALEKLLKHTGNEGIYSSVAKTLGKIDPGNAQAIAVILQLLIQTASENGCEWLVESLGEIITTNPQRQSVVSALQPHLSDETYENNYDLYKYCYALLWKIAQDLPYPDFYRAWHHLDTAPHPEVADQTPVGKTALTDTLNAQLLDLANQLHPTPHTTPVCVDIQHLTQITDEDKLAKALSNRIFQHLFPGQTLPKISDCFDLETELINAQPRPHIALILHNGDPQESLLHLCQFLASTVSIACITHTPLDAPLRGFPPDQENLVSALQSWLEQFNEQ